MITLSLPQVDEGAAPAGVPWGTIQEGGMQFNRNVNVLRTGPLKGVTVRRGALYIALAALTGWGALKLFR